MAEWLSSIFNSPEATAIFASIIAWLTANAGTLIVFAIKYIKLKAKELKQKAENDEVIAAIEAKYDAKLADLYEKFISKMDSVENKVVNKIAEQDAEHKAQIKAETVQLETAISQVKETLKIDDILED